MFKNKRTRLRLTEASQVNWQMLEGITDPDRRRRFAAHLRDREMVVFPLRESDARRFGEIVGGDSWLCDERDPVIVAELVCRNHPELFLTIEQAYSLAIDWRLRHSKTGMTGTGRGESRAPVPSRLLALVAESELDILLRRELRQRIKELNRDPAAAKNRVMTAAQAESDDKRRLLLERLGALMGEISDMKFPDFQTEIVAGQPFPSMHVRLWIKQIMERGSVLIAGDVGTQKTSAAVVGLNELGDRSTVVFCRSYARELVWVKELRRYFREPVNPIVIENGDDIAALEKMGPADLRQRRFLIVGYGGLECGQDGGYDAAFGERLAAAIARLDPDSVIIDEAHAAKGDGVRAERVMAIARLASVRHRIMLTATPFENRPNEVAAIATLMDPVAFPTEESFLAQCRDNPRIFFALMAGRMCDFFSQEDVLDLPESNYSVHDFFPSVEFACPADFQRVSRRIRNDGALRPVEQVGRLVRFLAVPQVGKHWYSELSGLACFANPLANPKLAYLKRETEQRIKRGKVIIASGLYAAGVTRAIADADETVELAGLFEGWFPGTVIRLDSRSSREEVTTAWQNETGKRIMVVSVQAAAESLNFTLRKTPGVVERVTIFWLGLPWKPTQYLQFNGRSRRPGTEVPVDSFVLIVKGTADEALLEMNRRKWRNFLLGVHCLPILAEEENDLERAAIGRMLAP